jgi:hypothetical protein
MAFDGEVRDDIWMQMFASTSPTKYMQAYAQMDPGARRSASQFLRSQGEEGQAVVNALRSIREAQTQAERLSGFQEYQSAYATMQELVAERVRLQEGVLDPEDPEQEGKKSHWEKVGDTGVEHLIYHNGLPAQLSMRANYLDADGLPLKIYGESGNVVTTIDQGYVFGSYGEARKVAQRIARAEMYLEEEDRRKKAGAGKSALSPAEIWKAVYSADNRSERVQRQRNVFDKMLGHPPWRYANTPEEIAAARARRKAINESILQDPARGNGFGIGEQITLPGVGGGGGLPQFGSGYRTVFNPKNPETNWRVQGKDGKFIAGPRSFKGKKLGPTDDEIKEALRRVLLKAYDDLGIGKSGISTGTLRRSLEKASVAIAHLDNGDSLLTIKPLQMYRDPRPNEPQPVPTDLYGPAVFFGRRAIMPRNQPMLRFLIAPGQWMIARSVKASEGRNVFAAVANPDGEYLGEFKRLVTEAYTARIMEGLSSV